MIFSLVSCTIMVISLTVTPVSGAPPPSTDPGGALKARTCGWSIVRSSGVSSMERGKESYALSGVAAISKNDVWVVGDSIARWNGSRWKVYKPVRAGRDQMLLAIAAASPKDVWAVGGDQGAAIGNGEVGSLIDHSNGRIWVRVRHIPTTAFLSAAAVMPNHHLWAAGGKWAGDGDYEAYVVHWDGHRWVGMAPPFGDPNPLEGIAAISPTDVLTVGNNNAYAAKRNGEKWTVVDQWTVGKSPVFAHAVTAVSPTDAWPWARVMAAQSSTGTVPRGALSRLPLL